MRSFLALVFAVMLAACSPQPVTLPDGVSCTDEELATVNDVPARANPDSPEYDAAYAAGWYLGHGCDVPFPSPPAP